MYVDREQRAWQEANRIQFATGTNLTPLLRKETREKYCGMCTKKDKCKLVVHLNMRGQLICREEEVKL
jgi:formamidopyrimidine-DNA glycosylase